VCGLCVCVCVFACAFTYSTRVVIKSTFEHTPLVVFTLSLPLSRCLFVCGHMSETINIYIYICKYLLSHYADDYINIFIYTFVETIGVCEHHSG
jgi:hypothetical protein